jgi:hypothetical protein
MPKLPATGTSAQRMEVDRARSRWQAPTQMGSWCAAADRAAARRAADTTRQISEQRREAQRGQLPTITNSRGKEGPSDRAGPADLPEPTTARITTHAVEALTSERGHQRRDTWAAAVLTSPRDDANAAPGLTTGRTATKLKTRQRYEAHVAERRAAATLQRGWRTSRLARVFQLRGRRAHVAILIQKLMRGYHGRMRMHILATVMIRFPRTDQMLTIDMQALTDGIIANRRLPRRVYPATWGAPVKGRPHPDRLTHRQLYRKRRSERRFKRLQWEERNEAQGSNGATRRGYADEQVWPDELVIPGMATICETGPVPHPGRAGSAGSPGGPPPGGGRKRHDTGTATTGRMVLRRRTAKHTATWCAVGSIRDHEPDVRYATTQRRNCARASDRLADGRPRHLRPPGQQPSTPTRNNNTQRRPRAAHT